MRTRSNFGGYKYNTYVALRENLTMKGDKMMKEKLLKILLRERAP